MEGKPESSTWETSRVLAANAQMLVICAGLAERCENVLAHLQDVRMIRNRAVWCQLVHNRGEPLRQRGARFIGRDSEFLRQILDRVLPKCLLDLPRAHRLILAGTNP